VSLEVFPVKATKKQGKFDLYDEIKKLVEENDISLKNGDVLVISSKYISNSQGRILTIILLNCLKMQMKYRKNFLLTKN